MIRCCINWVGTPNSSVPPSLSAGHICQPVSGGRPLFRLQHRRLQVSGWHDSAHPAQPEDTLRLLHRSHQQETTFCLHLLPKGEDEEAWDLLEQGAGGKDTSPIAVVSRDYWTTRNTGSGSFSPLATNSCSCVYAFLETSHLSDNRNGSRDVKVQQRLNMFSRHRTLSFYDFITLIKLH